MSETEHTNEAADEEIILAADRLIEELSHQHYWFSTALRALMESHNVAMFTLSSPGKKSMRVLLLGGTVYIYDPDDNRYSDTIALQKPSDAVVANAAPGEGSEG